MYNEYVVQSNDSLSKIADEFGISLEELLSANGWQDLTLKDGQKIMIPSSVDMPFVYYTVEKGDNLYQIAGAYGIDVNTLALLNKINPNQTLFVGDKIMIPKEGYGVYITNDTDSIQKVLKNTGKTFEEIHKLNPSISLSPNQVILYQI